MGRRGRARLAGAGGRPAGGGKKIAAIKLYRRHSGADLKDAKEAVEGIAARLRIAAPQRAGCLSVLLVLAILLAAAVRLPCETFRRAAVVGLTAVAHFSASIERNHECLKNP